jgi:hypothetical protein
MKTKLLRNFIAACGILILFSTAYGQEMTLQNYTAGQGESFSIALDITEAMDYVGAMSLYINFNDDVLQFNGITIVMSQAAGTLADVLPGANPMIGISWLAPGVTGVNFPTGTMLTINFTALDCDNVPLNFNQALCEIVDWDINVIPVNYINGSVTMISVPVAQWTGAINNDWNNPANWNVNAVPGCNTAVTISESLNHPVIPGGKALFSVSSLTLAQGSALTVDGMLIIDGDLILQSGVDGTGSLIDNGTVTVGGLTTIERAYASAPAWHLISSPIADGLAGIYNGMYLQKYMEPTAQWIDIIDPAELLVPAQGYALWTATSGIYQYVGARNTGSIGIPVTASQPFGWNLLGNPYPSSLDWNLVTVANPAINGAVYYLNSSNGNYVSYNGGMGGGTQYVPAGQGFFVSAANAGTFAVNNTMRTHLGNDNYYKSDFENMLVLKAEGNNYSDATYLRFDEQATSAFDGQFDAYKLMSSFNEELPQIYTRTSDVNLSINVLPFVQSVPLSFLAGVDGNYSISIDESYGMEYIYLEDLMTGVTVDLLNGDYLFDYSTGDNSDRFVLHFTILSIYDITSNTVQIYSSNDQVHIILDKLYNGDIRVYDMMGREVKNQTIESIEHELTLDGGCFYVVMVTTDESNYTEKVYIK